MEHIWQRFVENIFGRIDGPYHFRIILQPLIAIIFAVIDGLKDAKMGKPPYFWAVIYNPEHRRELLKDGWKHVGKIFIFAIVLDIIYQLKVFQRIYPTELIIVSVILAIIPYLLLRGLVNRIVRQERNNNA